ncbi:MAG: hypothetical protein BSOLF_0292 [Candidatus Carbobacillus altaicus]|uniref:Uncharacterized protein n=1 Tax=Candidatus Carbonibacillus altaicus TaxID=2163959 RepID=A0A2R6Y103_9BACL|nr:MAG: hypothetical protein BSOLF_0292 [Candidatus Carbobacillus altaicus]
MKENQKMTMGERIQAFYLQSGGPNNEKINKLLEKHLLYGKDHGAKGYKETFEDAFMETVLNDPSLLLMYQHLQRWRAKKMKQNERGEEELHRLIERLKALEVELTNIKVTLEEKHSNLKRKRDFVSF